MEGPILVCVAHPDDEVLGAGGTILKHRDVHILIMTDGAGGVRGYNVDRLTRHR